MRKTGTCVESVSSWKAFNPGAGSHKSTERERKIKIILSFTFVKISSQNNEVAIALSARIYLPVLYRYQMQTGALLTKT